MRMNIKKSLKLITLLMSSIIIATVSATAYVNLQWTTTATAETNPKVCFFAWASPDTKLNTFDYAVNIFPSIKTVDENITHGIWNWDTTGHTVYIRIYSISNQSDISSITTYVKTQDGATTKATVTWSGGGSLPTTPVSFSAEGQTRYLIWTEITASSSASGSCTITYELKVENP
jgi:hypothetical protein